MLCQFPKNKNNSSYSSVLGNIFSHEFVSFTEIASEVWFILVTMIDCDSVCEIIN